MMTNNTYEVIKKVVSAIAEAKGYAYTAGYLESKLVSIIDKYVKDEAEVQKLHIMLLAEAIDKKLDNKVKQNVST